MKKIIEFKRGIQSELIARVLGTGASALLIVFLARFMGPGEYGLLFLVLSILSIAGMFGKLGLGKSTGRYLTEYNQRDRSQVWYILKSSLTINIVLLIIVAGILTVGAQPIADYFNEPDIAFLLVIGGAYVLVEGLFIYLRRCLQGFQEIKAGANLKILNEVSLLGIVVVLVLLGYGAAGALFGYVISYLLTIVAGFSFLLYIVFTQYEKTADPEEGLVRRIVEYSLPITLTDSSDKIIKEVDILLIGIFLTPVAVGYYKISKQLIQFTQLPASTVGYSLSPAFSDKKIDEGLAEASELYEETLVYTLLIYIPAAVGLVLVAEPVVILLVGADYAAAVPVVQIMALFALFQGITHVTSGGLDYLGRATDRAKVKFVAAVGNLLLNILLIPQIGIVGAAIATVAAYGFYTAANVFIMSLELEFRVGYLARKVGQIIAISGCMAVAVLAAQSYLGGFLSLVVSIFFGVVVWGLLSVSLQLIRVSELVPQRT